MEANGCVRRNVPSQHCGVWSFLKWPGAPHSKQTKDLYFAPWAPRDLQAAPIVPWPVAKLLAVIACGYFEECLSNFLLFSPSAVSPAKVLNSPIH
ncbi:hypothetical protein Tco_0137673 [Tanacetum coccineum]